VKSNQNKFFAHELALLCKEHLPKVLLPRLYLIDLIQKQQVSFHEENKRQSVAFKLARINYDSLLYPTCISITITRIYPENASAPSLLNKTQSTYIFCKKNLAEWSEVDENGKEQNQSNFSAYLFEHNALLEQETRKAVKNIAETISKVKPVLTKPEKKEEEACACVIF